MFQNDSLASSGSIWRAAQSRGSGWQPLRLFRLGIVERASFRSSVRRILVGFVGLEPSDPRLCAALHITYKIDNGIVLPRWVEEETQEVSKISHSGFGGFQRWLFGFIGVRAGDYTTDQLIVIKEAFDSLSHDPNNPQNSPEYYIHTISNIPNNSDIHLVYRYHPAKPYLEYDDFYEVGSCQ